MWPGSAHTALLFVGLPLLVALILLATPLHDVTAPPSREDVALLADPAVSDPFITGAALPGYEVTPPERPARRRLEREPVPAVIFEPRRVVRVVRDGAGEARRTQPPVEPVRALVTIRRVAEPLPVRPALGVVDGHTRALLRDHQSP